MGIAELLTPTFALHFELRIADATGADLLALARALTELMLAVDLWDAHELRALVYAAAAEGQRGLYVQVPREEH